MNVAEPYYYELNMMSKVLFVTSIQVTDSLLKLDNEYTKLIEKFDFEIKGKYDNLDKILVDAEIQKPLILSLEDELCLYSCLHIAAAYSLSENFMDWFYVEVGIPEEERLSPEDRSEGAIKLHTTLTLMLTVIEDKLANFASFLTRKEELNKHLPVEPFKPEV